MPELPVDTLGGLVMALLDKVPEPGDSVRYRNLQFDVEKTRGRRITAVKLHLLSEEANQKGSSAANHG